jgi:hypothetical protein
MVGDKKHKCKACGKRIKVRCTFCGEIFSQANKYHQNNCEKNPKRLKVDLKKKQSVRVPTILRFSSFLVPSEILPSIFYSRYQIGGIPCIIKRNVSTLQWNLDYLKEKIPNSNLFVKICNKSTQFPEDRSKLPLILI